INFVGAGMKQVFALQINLGAAQLFAQAGGEKQRRGTSGIGSKQTVEASFELRITLGFGVGNFEFLERSHQDFGDIASAINAEASGSRFRFAIAWNAGSGHYCELFSN